MQETDQCGRQYISASWSQNKIGQDLKMLPYESINNSADHLFKWAFYYPLNPNMTCCRCFHVHVLLWYLIIIIIVTPWEMNRLCCNISYTLHYPNAILLFKLFRLSVYTHCFFFRAIELFFFLKLQSSEHHENMIYNLYTNRTARLANYYTLVWNVRLCNALWYHFDS